MSISVIVPVYNREALIAETLTSLLRQTLRPSEIIVVDDGSTDGTLSELEKFGDEITVLRQQNLGPGAARNAGLKIASGTYIQFFDSDDLASSNTLVSKIRALQKDDADIAYGPWIPAWLGGGDCRSDGFVRQSRAIDSDALDAFLRGWVLFIPNCLIRRDLLQKVGGYPVGMLTGEDMLLMFRLLSEAPRLAHTHEPLLLVRQHPSDQISAAREWSKRRAEDELRLCDAVISEVKPIAAQHKHALKAWDVRRTLSVTAARQLGVFVDEPTKGEKVRAALQASLLRIERGMQLRVAGHRIERCFSPKRIDGTQVNEIRRLGYRYAAPVNPENL